MTVGASGDTAIGFLSAVFQQQPFSIGQIWAQKHIGDPGAAGTANLAADVDRVNVSSCFSTDPVVSGSYAQIINDALMGLWAAATAAYTPSHLSLWTLTSGGVYIGSGTVTSAALAIGDLFTVPIGDFTAKIPIAA